MVKRWWRVVEVMMVKVEVMVMVGLSHNDGDNASGLPVGSFPLQTT